MRCALFSVHAFDAGGWVVNAMEARNAPGFLDCWDCFGLYVIPRMLFAADMCYVFGCFLQDLSM